MLIIHSGQISNLLSIAYQDSWNGPSVQTDPPLPLLIAIAILKHERLHYNSRIWQQPGSNKVHLIGLYNC